MYATEIVKSEMKRDGGFQVRQLLAEGVCQSGESPAHHPNRQVLAFALLGHYR